MPKRKKTRSNWQVVYPTLMLIITAALIARYSLQRETRIYPPLPVSVDVIVVGSGLAGATAALTAADAGADVYYIDLSEPDAGGFPAFSPAFWAADTPAQAAGEIEYSAEAMGMDIFSRGRETGDFTQILRVSRQSLESLNWLETLTGASFSLADPQVNPGLHVPDAGTAETIVLREIMKRLSTAESVIHTRDEPVNVFLQGGRVQGMTVRTEAGEQKVYAQAVILADGGFGSQEQMLEAYAGIRGVTARPEGGNRGVGLRIAVEAGAKREFMDQVMLLPVYLPEGRRITTERFPGAVLIGEGGAVADPGEDLAAAILAARRMYVITGAGNPLADRNYTQIDDPQIVAAGLGLDVAELMEHMGALEPPYRVAVLGVIALTPGGLAVDEHYRVLGGNGPILGLYAAGEITAGLHGSLTIPDLFFSEAVVGARIAGQEAARFSLR